MPARRRSVLALLVAVACTAAAPPRADDLAGRYDGGGPEIAAGLELRSDGRFRYGLAYGALDETAEGRWRVEAGRVLLASDPVSPPRFVLGERRETADGSVRVGLDVPAGLSRQYFRVEATVAGTVPEERQFAEADEAVVVAAAGRPLTLTVVLPLYDVRSEPVAVRGAAGQRLRLRFEPGDLGKAAFADTPLAVEGGSLLLHRHGRVVRFRRLR